MARRQPGLGPRSWAWVVKKYGRPPKKAAPKVPTPKKTHADVLKDYAIRYADSEGEDKAARRYLERLLPHTTPGKRYAKYHPGAVTAYRGSPEQDRKRYASWSLKKRGATPFAEYPNILKEGTLSRATPALDINKVLRDAKTRHSTEHEVLVDMRAAAKKGWETRRVKYGRSGRKKSSSKKRR